jgi:class 3 adenylate cyclase/tetratricopeptide (TPR) repeat protein
MSCPQCGQPIAPAARFCSHCGARQELRCPSCQERNAPASRFCSHCGEVLTAGAAAAPPKHLADRILTSRGALEGERKHVTILFADLRGSMELLADRDPEEARKILDPVLERMIEAVHHYEGTVNQVMGDGIMALFGAPLAHEDHALRACYAALRMQERVGAYGDELQRSVGVPVQIRVGLHSGDVVVRSISSDLHMDYSAVGQSTHVAARMEQMAKPASTLMTSATHALVEGYVRVRAVGPVPVKGLAQPVEVLELLGSAASRTRLEVSAGRGLTRFIGREAEEKLVHAALAHASQGRGQVVALVGEPGVGKSRLVWEVTNSHRAQGWLVLQASAVAYGKSTPFLPVVELIRSYLGVEGGDDERRVREKLMGKVLALDEKLRSLLPAIEAVLDLPADESAWAGSSERRRSAIIDAVRQVLLRESAVQPLLLVFEDLHWLDDDTQALLESLIASVPSHRVLLVVNYRPEYVHAWASKTYYVQIRLDPLPPESAETLLQALLGATAATPSLTARLIEQTHGNPFFLEEAVRTLVDAGALVGERGAFQLVQSPQNLRMPETVHALLAARIDRLAPEDKHVLQAASVVGVQVPFDLLREIAEVPEAELLSRLGRLRSAEFLYETRLFPDVEHVFKHALTHEVAYAGLLHERRRALHATLVDVIERRHAGRLGDYRDDLVRHAFRGEVWSKALTHLRGLTPVVSPDQIDSVMGVGTESPGQLWWSGEHERAVRAAERDRAVGVSFGNFAMRLLAICRLGQAYHSLGDFTRAAEFLTQATEMIPVELQHEGFGMTAPASVWARTWLAWTHAERGEFEIAVEVAADGAAIAEAAQHVYAQVQAAFGRGIVHVIQRRPDRAIPVLERALVTARLENISFLVPFITGVLGAAYTLDGRVPAALTMLSQTVDQASAIGLVANQPWRLVWLGHAQLRGNAPEAALDSARRALALADEHRERGQHAYAQRLIGEIMAATGDLDTARTALRDAQRAAEALGMRPLRDECRESLARLTSAREGGPR